MLAVCNRTTTTHPGADTWVVVLVGSLIGLRLKLNEPPALGIRKKVKVGERQ